MPFGRDTHVIPNNTVLDKTPSSHGKGRFGGRNPQFTVMPPVAKLFWPLLLVSASTILRELLNLTDKCRTIGTIFSPCSMQAVTGHQADV